MAQRRLEILLVDILLILKWEQRESWRSLRRISENTQPKIRCSLIENVPIFSVDLAFLLRERR